MPTPDLAGLRILVVDDHADTVAMLQFALEDAGAQVRTCLSPEAALEAMASATFEVIVTDLGFGSDRRAGERIHVAARQQLAGRLVIALTGRREAQRDLLAMGFDAVLVKPVDPFELVARMGGLLKRAGP